MRFAFVRSLSSLAAIGIVFAAGARAQGEPSPAEHERHHGPVASAPPGFAPALVGEYAFATIAEVANALRADPDTDWSRVDLSALREHLRDMSRVTLDAEVAAASTPRGATFLVTSDDPAVAESIARMTADHSQALSSGHGDAPPWTFEAEPIELGARVTVTGSDEAAGEMIRGLGFHGILADGDHHRAHHVALAAGSDPH